MEVVLRVLKIWDYEFGRKISGKDNVTGVIYMVEVVRMSNFFEKKELKRGKIDKDKVLGSVYNWGLIGDDLELEKLIRREGDIRVLGIWKLRMSYCKGVVEVLNVL